MRMIMPSRGAPPSVSAPRVRKDAGNEFEGRLHLGAEGGLRIEFRRSQNGLQDRANIALGLGKGRAVRSTTDAGGSSATKWRQSLSEMKCAVEGCAARI